MLDDDKKRYGMKDGGPGIEALREEAPEVVERMGYEEGGLLEDERKPYAIGSLVSKLVSKNFAKRNPKVAVQMYRDIDDKFGVTTNLDELKTLSPNDAKKALDYFKAKKLSEKAEFKERGRLDSSDADYYGEVERKKIFREIDEQYKEQIKVLNDIVARNQKAEGGSMDDQMLMVMTPPMESEMEPDGEMEDNYTRFIMEEALSEEEEDMLTSKLEQDEELSMLFDKIIDVAQEFAGSGPVEGPGSGVSDSIPARLSDGEFVFTAKAVEEIGEDALMSMMKEAEAAADERQMANVGGVIREEKEIMAVEKKPVEQNINVTKTTVDSQAGMLSQQEDLVGKAVKENMMLDPYQRHVRS